MASFRYVVADVFTDTPLAGNPVAVFTDARELPEERMQPLARELNLSETVFVLPAEQGGHARIRIFTPKVELPFAGHPTLGTAFVLGAPMQLVEIRLETGVGIVPVRLEREGARIVFGRILHPIPERKPFADEEGLLAALGIERSVLPVEGYNLFVYTALDDSQELAELKPDLAYLEGVGLGVACVAPEDDHWKFRMWAPAFGVPEDPATGSAAGPLAVYLASHGKIAFGDEIAISQGTEVGRPSMLYARAEGTAERIERVEVGGAAVVVARGEFRL